MLKKNNSHDLRLCIDFRELNKRVVKDHYDVPLIDDQLDLLKNKKHFTTLDLKSGFHHVRLSEDSCQYTFFITPMGQFEWTRLPFGICNGPSVFCRFVNKIFQPLIKSQKILIYIDDILIATTTIEENILIFFEVLKIMSENLLALRLDKCSFLEKKILYLG